MSGWRVGRRRGDWARSLRCALTRHAWQVNPRSGQRVCSRCWTVIDQYCHNGHPFTPGVSTDHAPGESDPRWCNTCGEAVSPTREDAR